MFLAVWVPRCHGWRVWGTPVPPSWVLPCVPWCRDRRTFPRAWLTHGGGFGEDNVLWGAGWAWWHHLMTPSKAWWQFPARFGGFTWWFPARAVSPSVPSSSSSPLLPSSSPEQGIPLALLAAVTPVHFPRFGGAVGRGSLSPRPSRCSPVVGGAPAVFPGKEPLSQFGSVSMATALSFPSRSGSAATGAALGVHPGPGGHRARPVPVPSRTGPWQDLRVELIPREHPRGARRDHPAPGASGAILPEKHPGGLSVMRDSRRAGEQPGAVCLWSIPRWEPSLGAVGDGAPARLGV